MFATVYFIHLNETERLLLNASDNKVFDAYMSARNGNFNEANFHMLKKAASGDFNNAEHAWISLQNLNDSWTENEAITCHTDFPRSMDVGDIIVWQDGTAERCDNIGFAPIKLDFLEA